VYFLYILQSESTGRFYIGQTQDLPERLAYHNANYSKFLKSTILKKLLRPKTFFTQLPYSWS
jgi:predicted GIY-YIG superfamily endonuclease